MMSLYTRTMGPAAAPTPPYWRHILLLLLLTIVTCGPVLRYGLPNLGNDSVDHARWGQEFGRQLWDGEIYPRWLMDANSGLGSVAFFFYPPLPNYMAAIFWPATQYVDPAGWLAMGWACVLAVFLSGVATYFWCRSFAEPKAALLAGAVYILQPYHLAVNMYTRGAAGELWANVWPPLILLSVERLRRGSRWAFLGLAVSYALLIFNHLPTTLCFSLVPLAAAWFLSEKPQRLSVLFKTATAMALGVCLAGAFLLPALLDQKNAYIEETHQGFFVYYHWWLFQLQPLLDARTRLMLMTISVMAFVGIAGWLFWCRESSGLRKRLGAFYLGVAAFAIFMATQLSAPMWMLLTPLQGMQFPTRFLQVFALAPAAMAALAYPYFGSHRLARLGAVACVTAWMIAALWGASAAFTVWRPIPQDWADKLAAAVRTQREYFYFWPRTSTRAQEVQEFPTYFDFVEQNPPRSWDLTALSSGQPTGQASILNWKARHIMLKMDVPEPSHFLLRHFMYPGWTAYVEIPGRSLPVSPSKPDGFLEMELPSGTYTLHLVLAAGTPERVGVGLTIGSAGIAALIALWIAFTRRRPA